MKRVERYSVTVNVLRAEQLNTTFHRMVIKVLFSFFLFLNKCYNVL